MIKCAWWMDWSWAWRWNEWECVRNHKQLVQIRPQKGIFSWFWHDLKRRSLTTSVEVWSASGVTASKKKDKGKVKSKSVSAKCFQVVLKGCNNQHISGAAGVLWRETTTAGSAASGKGGALHSLEDCWQQTNDIPSLSRLSLSGERRGRSQK